MIMMIAPGKKKVALPSRQPKPRNAGFGVRSAA